jgi:hypothetical protein
MKQQVKLTESGLYDVIREAVNFLIMEFGSDPGKKGAENREKMAKASKRALKKGDSSVYQNSVNSITKGGGDKEALADFNKKFETDIEEDSDVEELSGDFNTQPANNLAAEGRQQFKVTESQLKDIIKESVRSILKEIGDSQVGQYQLGRLAARKKEQGDDDAYKNVVNHAKLQWGADRGTGSNQNAFGNGMHVGKDNAKQGYNLAKQGKL